MTDIPLEVDYRRIIKMLGGPAEVAAALPDVTSTSAYFWSRRNSVPGKFVPGLLALAISKGVISSIEDAPRVDPFERPAADEDADT